MRLSSSLRFLVVTIPLVLASGCGGSSPTPAAADMAITPDMTVAPDLLPPPPAAPTNLKAAPLGGGAHLTWKDNSTDEDGFMIMRKDGTAAYMMLTTVPFNTIAFHDAPLVSGTTYSYMVHAMKGDSLSAPSNEVMIKIP